MYDLGLVGFICGEAECCRALDLGGKGGSASRKGEVRRGVPLQRGL